MRFERSIRISETMLRGIEIAEIAFNKLKTKILHGTR